MAEKKTLEDCADDFDKVLNDHRPIPYGTFAMLLIAIVPFLIWICLLSFLTAYLNKMDETIAVLIACLICVVSYLLPRICGGITGTEHSVFKFFREYYERNHRGRTVAFYFDDRGILQFSLSKEPFVFLSGKITLNIPLGGYDRSVLVRYGHCDLMRRYSISSHKTEYGEKWSYQPTANMICMFPLVPRFDLPITRDHIHHVGLILNAIHDIDECRGNFKSVEDFRFSEVMSEE